jgi:hypothetical protein
MLRAELMCVAARRARWEYASLTNVYQNLLDKTFCCHWDSGESKGCNRLFNQQTLMKRYSDAEDEKDRISYRGSAQKCVRADCGPHSKGPQSVSRLTAPGSIKPLAQPAANPPRRAHPLHCAGGTARTLARRSFSESIERRFLVLRRSPSFSVPSGPDASWLHPFSCYDSSCRIRYSRGETWCRSPQTP